jgi:hypothetical protein
MCAERPAKHTVHSTASTDMSKPNLNRHPPARLIAARQGHKGALLPGHVRQAYAQLEADRRTPHSRALRRPLR